jgi:methionine-rich copper-binding protein CopC
MRIRGIAPGLFLIASVGAAMSLLGLVVPVTRAEAGHLIRHLTLDQTVPAADTTVTASVTEVRLTFSEAPLLRGTSVRVVDSGRSLMASSPPSTDESDPRGVMITLDPALPSGAYTVQWRVIAQDGHVMRGNFGFEVRAE